MARTYHGLRFMLAPALLLAATLGCGKTDVISVDGSSTVFLISAAIAEELHAVNPAVKVVVGQSGTGGGFKKFSAGEIDMCDASRPITENEAAACAKAGIEYIELQVAFDGLSVVVNPQNDWCDSLTLEQLTTIWRPESEDSILKWSDVDPDWPDEELKLYGPGPDSGTYDYFNEVVNGNPRSCRQDYQRSENDNALVFGVAGDKGSLGYFGLGSYVENTDKLKLLAIDSGDGPQLPSEETVRNGAYKPLSRPLFVYVRKSSLANPGVATYLKYYLENVGKIAPRVGYVPLSDEIAAQTEARLTEALASHGAAPPSQSPK
jgi:phosphate transport system substrate-binding protein